jgi:hypothetical protein
MYMLKEETYIYPGLEEVAQEAVQEIERFLPKLVGETMAKLRTRGKKNEPLPDALSEDRAAASWCSRLSVVIPKVSWLPQWRRRRPGYHRSRCRSSSTSRRIN